MEAGCNLGILGSAKHFRFVAPLRLFPIIGIVFLLLASLVNWLIPPLTHPLTAYDIPLFDGMEGNGTLSAYFTFGYLVLSLGIAGALVIFKGSNWMRLIIGLMAIMSAIIFFQKLFVWNPELLRSLVDQNQQYAGMIQFSESYLPTNVGVEPTFSRDIEVNSGIGRILTLWHFMGFGWVFCLAGGILLIPFRSLNFISGKLAYLILGVLLLMIVIPPIPVAISEYYIDRGEKNHALGLYNNAIIDYSSARRWDPSIGQNEIFIVRVGSVYRKLGRLEEPEYYIFEAQRLISMGLFMEAVLELDKAENKAKGLLRNLIQLRVARFYVLYGLSQFEEMIIGGAIAAWKTAFQIDPNQIQAFYYLSRAHYDMADYDRSIQSSRAFLSQSVNPLINANVYMNLGDSYTKKQEFQSARKYYSLSLASDHNQNYRGLKSLVGP